MSYSWKTSRKRASARSLRCVYGRIVLVYITGAHCEINLETSARRASAVASNCTEWYSPPLTSTYAACAGWQDVDIGTHSNAGLRVQIDRGLGALFFFFFFYHGCHYEACSIFNYDGECCFIRDANLNRARVDLKF